MSDFRKLRVWVSARQLAIDVHRVTSRMRGARNAALRDQLVRAAMSVPTNIIEGNAHESVRERGRYFRYALASVSELEGHLQLSHDFRMISEQEYHSMVGHVVDVRKMLHGLLKRLKETEDGDPAADET